MPFTVSLPKRLSHGPSLPLSSNPKGRRKRHSGSLDSPLILASSSDSSQESDAAEEKLSKAKNIETM
ncbi:26444_t:CDS:2 [Dentiscutata erythropus]|uniref:26444_t:CDS:1 n=1 Tax=Dentiscutata erythropus TaxID=1348616 RepID=A0A9N8ZKX7_9GLOM|nr:26444_t:CDS:2 [Dentiscutata erythropus]